MSSMTIDDIINFAVRHKQKYVALVDVNVMYGAIEFYNKAIANKLQPIIGLKITLANEPIILIAKNNEGYHSLIKLSSAIMSGVPYNINDYVNHLYIIVHDASKSSFSDSKDVYSILSSAHHPIALQECFFENRGEDKYVRALMAIGHESRLADVSPNHEYEDKYMLSEEEAAKKFSSEAMKNLDSLLKSCS
jgi:DNA polymerase-3 subunit alpha